MEYRPLGNSDLHASVVGLGTWVLGGGSVWGQDTDDQESIRTVHAALDAGINLIDTAPAYGWGRSEEIVGKAIKGRRDKVILATKCGLWTDDDRGSFFTELDGRIMRRSLRPDTITVEIERSLQRLGVDCIDLYQTHWPSCPPDATSISDTMACLLKLRDAGKIRAIGVSNASSKHMDEYRAGGPLDSDQERYSMLSREIEKDQLPYCHRHGVAVLAYSPLAQGLLTGKVTAGRSYALGDLRRDNPRFAGDALSKVEALLAKIQPIAAKHRATVSQVVIAWTLAQPGLTHALCGARTPEQVEENAKAGDLVLSAEDVKTIDAALR